MADQKKRIEMTFDRMFCFQHGEPFRAKYPETSRWCSICTLHAAARALEEK